MLQHFHLPCKATPQRFYLPNNVLSAAGNWACQNCVSVLTGGAEGATEEQGEREQAGVSRQEQVVSPDDGGGAG